MADAARAQRCDELGRVGAQLVGHDDRAQHAPVRTDVHARHARAGVRADRARRKLRRARIRATRIQPRLPTATRRPSTEPDDPSARLLAHVRGAVEHEARARCASATSASASTCGGELIDRGGQAQQLDRSDAVAGLRSRARAGAPIVSVPVLSNRTVRARPSASIAAAPLTITPRRAARETPETSAIGAARISGHGVATTTTASARTGSPLAAHARARGEQRQREEERGVAVGEPHERRARALGALDEADERGVGGLRRPVASPAARRARPRSPCR